MDSINDPELKVDEDDRIVVIKDKYPKVDENTRARANIHRHTYSRTCTYRHGHIRGDTHTLQTCSHSHTWTYINVLAFRFVQKIEEISRTF